jgi:hypothetical protein
VTATLRTCGCWPSCCSTARTRSTPPRPQRCRTRDRQPSRPSRRPDRPLRTGAGSSSSPRTERRQGCLRGTDSASGSRSGFHHASSSSTAGSAGVATGSWSSRTIHVCPNGTVDNFSGAAAVESTTGPHHERRARPPAHVAVHDRVDLRGHGSSNDHPSSSSAWPAAYDCSPSARLPGRFPVATAVLGTAERSAGTIARGTLPVRSAGRCDVSQLVGMRGNRE